MLSCNIEMSYNFNNKNKGYMVKNNKIRAMFKKKGKHLMCFVIIKMCIII